MPTPFRTQRIAKTVGISYLSEDIRQSLQSVASVLAVKK
jgi:hypothetical protein